MSLDKKTSERIHVSLAPKIAEMLDKIADNKGLSRSAVMAIAIEKYFREENSNNGVQK